MTSVRVGIGWRKIFTRVYYFSIEKKSKVMSNH